MAAPHAKGLWQFGAIVAALALPAPVLADPTTQALNSEPVADHIVLGVGGAVVPTYEGSNATRVLPMPLIDIKQGIFVANVLNGVGVAWPTSGPISFGASITYVRGYRQQDVPVGIDHVAGAAGGRFSVTARQWGFIGTLGLTKPFGGAGGLTGDLLVSYPFHLARRVTVIPSVGTSWANAHYNNRYLGITQQESLASGLAAYQPGAGFKDANAGMAVNYGLTRHWSVSAGGAVTRVLGNAAEGPLVQRKTNGQAYAGLSYRF
ncbi:MAG: MipA/OmpV family protein [Sphingomonadales bacterium]|nr:MipA/OmpV family protein [Sphingomonadales bacterium]MDE2172168.1 MipA/OmpV family protein [Sphingomonadales bacterium]